MTGVSPSPCLIWTTRFSTVRPHTADGRRSMSRMPGWLRPKWNGSWRQMEMDSLRERKCGRWRGSAMDCPAPSRGTSLRIGPVISTAVFPTRRCTRPLRLFVSLGGESASSPMVPCRNRPTRRPDSDSCHWWMAFARRLSSESRSLIPAFLKKPSGAALSHPRRLRWTRDGWSEMHLFPTSGVAEPSVLPRCGYTVAAPGTRATAMHLMR